MAPEHQDVLLEIHKELGVMRDKFDDRFSRIERELAELRTVIDMMPNERPCEQLLSICRQFDAHIREHHELIRDRRTTAYRIIATLVAGMIIAIGGYLMGELH